jgi:hypothetical protein
VGTGRGACCTGVDSQARRLMFIRCMGLMLSEVMLPPGAPQPSVFVFILVLV